MGLYVVSCTDRGDAGGLRAETRERHLAYLREASATVKAAGALLDAGGERVVGSMLVIEADGLAAAGAFADADPYARAGLFADVDIQPWRLAVGAVG